MINLDVVKKIYSKPELKGIKQKAKKRVVKPRKSSIDSVIKCIGSVNTAKRSFIIKNTDLSFSTVDRILELLLSEEKIIKTVIGKSGPHDICKYKLNNEKL